MEGGATEGLCPPQLGVWGLVLRKKINFALKNYAILSKFWYFLPILQQKVGDYPPVLKVGDLSPCLPCSDAYACSGSVIAFTTRKSKFKGLRERTE